MSSKQTQETMPEVTPAEESPAALRRAEIERMKAKILEVRQPTAYLQARPSSTPWQPPMARPTYHPPKVIANRAGSDDFLRIKSLGN